MWINSIEMYKHLPLDIGGASVPIKSAVLAVTNVGTVVGIQCCAKVEPIDVRFTLRLTFVGFVFVSGSKVNLIELDLLSCVVCKYGGAGV